MLSTSKCQDHSDESLSTKSTDPFTGQKHQQSFQRQEKHKLNLSIGKLLSISMLWDKWNPKCKTRKLSRSSCAQGIIWYNYVRVLKDIIKAEKKEGETLPFSFHLEVFPPFFLQRFCLSVISENEDSKLRAAWWMKTAISTFFIGKVSILLVLARCAAIGIKKGSASAKRCDDESEARKATRVSRVSLSGNLDNDGNHRWCFFRRQFLLLSEKFQLCPGGRAGNLSRKWASRQTNSISLNK